MSVIKRLLMMLHKYNVEPTMEKVEVTDKFCPRCEEREVILIDKRVWWCKFCNWEKEEKKLDKKS